MRDFFEKLNALGMPKRSDITEKDFHIHRLLDSILNNEYLADRLAFKGGTCLIKAFLGYYRFSEDIDFTWQDKEIWESKSMTQVKHECSEEITKLIEHFKNIADKLDLNFSGDKSKVDEVHISSGGRMVTFFIGYHSDILDKPNRIKIEINFVDYVIYPFKAQLLHSYIETLDSRELEFLYEDIWKEYKKRIEFDCYDAREIFIEKCRAALTRKNYKFRDILDIYFMERKFKYSIKEFEPQIIEKTKFMLDMYKRYQDNIEQIDFPDHTVLDSEEMELLLIKPPDDLNKEVIRIHKELVEIKEKVLVRG